MAGLVCYYNSTKFHYLYISHDETLGKHLRVMSCAARLAAGRRLHARRSPIPAGAPCDLRVEVDYERLHFAYRVEGGATGAGCRRQFDASILSDEATAPGLPNFTGAFVGMACQDMSGIGAPGGLRLVRVPSERPYPGGSLLLNAGANRERVRPGTRRPTRTDINVNRHLRPRAVLCSPAIDQRVAATSDDLSVQA